MPHLIRLSSKILNELNTCGFWVTIVHLILVSSRSGLYWSCCWLV